MEDQGGIIVGQRDVVTAQGGDMSGGGEAEEVKCRPRLLGIDN